jgi:hypothetical protein
METTVYRREPAGTSTVIVWPARRPNKGRLGGDPRVVHPSLYGPDNLVPLGLRGDLLPDGHRVAHLDDVGVVPLTDLQVAERLDHLEKLRPGRPEVGKSGRVGLRRGYGLLEVDDPVL